MCCVLWCGTLLFLYPSLFFPADIFACPDFAHKTKIENELNSTTILVLMLFISMVTHLQDTRLQNTLLSSSCVSTNSMLRRISRKRREQISTFSSPLLHVLQIFAKRWKRKNEGELEILKNHPASSYMLTFHTTRIVSTVEASTCRCVLTQSLRLVTTVRSTVWSALKQTASLLRIELFCSTV